MVRRVISLKPSDAEHAEWVALCAAHGGPIKAFRVLLKAAQAEGVDLPAALERAAAKLRRLEKLERYAGASAATKNKAQSKP